MDCTQFSQQLDALVDGELSTEESRDVQGHMDKCADCSQRFEGAQRLKRLVQVKFRQQPVPPALGARIRESVAEDLVEDSTDPVPMPAPIIAGPGSSWRQRAAVLVVGVMLGLAGKMFYDDLHANPAMAHADVAHQALTKFVLLQEMDESEYCQPCSKADCSMICKKIVGAHVNLPQFNPQVVRVRAVSEDRIGQYATAHMHYSAGCSSGVRYRFSVFPLPLSRANIVKNSEVDKGYFIDDTLYVCKRLKGYSLLCCKIGDTYLSIVVNSGDPQAFYDEVLRDGISKGREKAAQLR